MPKHMSALIPGKPTAIAPRAWRLLALNPGMMTGPGTNSYLVGDTELAVIDPGPADERHLENLLKAAETIGAPIRQVLVTHTHRDHSPGAALLARELDIEVIGPDIPDDGLQDESFRPRRIISDGDRLTVGGVTLRAIATPGHVSNHFCYLAEQERLLFTGDHLIHGSTVVIAPPSGSMSAYIASLRKLLDEPVDIMAPGHGDLIRDPVATLEKTIAHRLERERKVAQALQENPGSRAADLVKAVYADVPAFLHNIATLSLEAHLIKLVEDNEAVAEDGRYRAK